MRSIAVALVGLLLACSAPPSLERPARPAPLLAPGGVLPRGARVRARLTAAIGTRRRLGADRAAEIIHPGQRFAAVVTTPIVDSSGRTRVPAGAIVEGRLVAANRGQGIHPATLELTVDRLCNRPIDAHVAGPAADQIVIDEYDKSLEGATFAWVLVGTLFFGMPGFMLGGAVGSASGTTARTRGRTVEGWLPAGTSVAIVIDEPTPLVPRCLV